MQIILRQCNKITGLSGREFYGLRALRAFPYASSQLERSCDQRTIPIPFLFHRASRCYQRDERSFPPFSRFGSRFHRIVETRVCACRSATRWIIAERIPWKKSRAFVGET